MGSRLFLFLCLMYFYFERLVDKKPAVIIIILNNLEF